MPKRKSLHKNKSKNFYGAIDGCKMRKKFLKIGNLHAKCLKTCFQTFFATKIFLTKVKWVVLGQNEKFDLYLDNGNEQFY